MSYDQKYEDRAWAVGVWTFLAGIALTVVSWNTPWFALTGFPTGLGLAMMMVHGRRQQ